MVAGRLPGRGAEQARIDALLAVAREGVSGALVIRGEPGIGKPALLEYAASRARGTRVLRGAPASSPRPNCRSPVCTCCCAPSSAGSTRYRVRSGGR